MRCAGGLPKRPMADDMAGLGSEKGQMGRSKRSWGQCSACGATNLGTSVIGIRSTLRWRR